MTGQTDKETIDNTVANTNVPKLTAEEEEQLELKKSESNKLKKDNRRVSFNSSISVTEFSKDMPIRP